MGNHQSSGPHERQEFIKVIDVTVFGRIDKDQINGSSQLGYALMRITFNDGNQALDAGSFKSFAAECRITRWCGLDQTI